MRRRPPAPALGTGFSHNWWLTFNQAKTLGGHVNRDERGCPVLFYQRVLVGEAAPPADRVASGTPEDERQYRPMLKVYTVFNAAQCSGLDLPAAPAVAWDPIQAAERIVEAVGLPIRYMGDQAFYQPQRDMITLPPRASFASPAVLYGTLLHELVHATGHEGRLARPFDTFGGSVYAWEELIAELGSAMLAVIVGVHSPNFPNIAAYVASWRKCMQRDTTAIAKAAAAAQKAVDWLQACLRQA